MLLINRTSTDPFFNIATEEYLVKSTDKPLIMLWQNKPSVIIGKHQNPYKEVNLSYTLDHKIPLIRRISGGGTVFHDLGNVNFSFIDFGKSDSLVNFKKYSKPVLDYLEQYNVKAKLIGKSDLKIGDHKISGNASHVYRNKVLHHGTILYDSNLKHLYNALRIFDNKIVDKSINSNRTQVTNVKEHMENPIDVKTFIKNFYRFIKNRYKNIEEAELTKLQVKEIGALVRDKYKSWDWNFAYSPKYTIGGDLKISNREYKIEFIVVKGFIADYSLKKISSGFSKTIHNMLENEAQIIKGIPHNVDILSKHLGAMKDKTLANQLYEILVSV